MEKLQPIGVKAAMNIPEGQKGPQNRESLVWILVDPAGVCHKAVNLLDWARKNSRPAMTYKGWTLSGLPTVKKPEDNEHNNKIL